MLSIYLQARLLVTEPKNNQVCMLLTAIALIKKLQKCDLAVEKLCG
jgi:hypothetical protein